MSERGRNILLITMIVIMGLASFASGFLLNDLIDLRGGRTVHAVEQDEFSVFWEAWERIEESFIGSLPDGRELTYGAVRGALQTLKDPYTVFIEPAAREQERQSLSGNSGGVGVNLFRAENGDLILLPIAGNPAEEAGILDGDILLAVDSQAVSTEQSLEDIEQLIRGEVGEPVTLTVMHPGSLAAVDIRIIRDIILIPSVSYRVLEQDPQIGYIALSRFSAESTGEVREAILALRQLGAEKLVLDLRHNGGGLLEAAVDVSDHFLSEGPILFQVSKDQDEKVFTASPETLAGDIPLVVLIDGATASAAEIVAGALRDQGRATLIGTRTFGKGSVQLIFDLSDGSSVHVTSARWLTPNRYQIDQRGLDPDVLVNVSAEHTSGGRDEPLERAIAFLQNRLVYYPVKIDE